MTFREQVEAELDAKGFCLVEHFAPYRKLQKSVIEKIARTEGGLRFQVLSEEGVPIGEHFATVYDRIEYYEQQGYLVKKDLKENGE